MTYWDTSCVIKLYTRESDSDFWQRLAVSERGDRASSALLEAELAFALRQKETRGEIVPGGAAVLLSMFRDDVKGGRIVLFPLGADVIRRAAALADEVADLRPPCPVRTLDGLHLATAAVLRCRGIATADARMKSGARFLGIPLVGSESLT